MTPALRGLCPRGTGSFTLEPKGESGQKNRDAAQKRGRDTAEAEGAVLTFNARRPPRTCNGSSQGRADGPEPWSPAGKGDPGEPGKQDHGGLRAEGEFLELEKMHTDRVFPGPGKPVFRKPMSGSI